MSDEVELMLMMYHKYMDDIILEQYFYRWLGDD